MSCLVARSWADQRRAALLPTFIVLEQQAGGWLRLGQLNALKLEQGLRRRLTRFNNSCCLLRLFNRAIVIMRGWLVDLLGQ